MKVLVCGSRKWRAKGPIERELRKLPPGTIIVHGAALGADSIANDIAIDLGFTIRPYPAKWTELGRAAGPIRNSEMLKAQHLPEEPIDKVLAFAEDFSPKAAPGTNDMMQKARREGIPVELFSV